MVLRSVAMEPSLTSATPSTGRVFHTYFAPLGSSGGGEVVPQVLQRVQRPLSKLQICAGLLSALAVVALTLNCFRICSGLRARNDLSRRLAGDDSSGNDGLGMWDIIRTCLEADDESDAAYLPPIEPTPHPSWQPVPHDYQELQTTTTSHFLPQSEATQAVVPHAIHLSGGPRVQRSDELLGTSTGTAAADLSFQRSHALSSASFTPPSGISSSSTVYLGGGLGQASSSGDSFLSHASIAVPLIAQSPQGVSGLRMVAPTTFGSFPGVGPIHHSGILLPGARSTYQGAHSAPQQQEEQHASRMTLPPSAEQPFSQVPSVYLSNPHQELTAQLEYPQRSGSFVVGEASRLPVQSQFTSSLASSRLPQFGEDPYARAAGGYVSSASRGAIDMQPSLKGDKHEARPFALPDPYGGSGLVPAEGSLGVMISGGPPTNLQQQPLPSVQPSTGSAHLPALEAALYGSTGTAYITEMAQKLQEAQVAFGRESHSGSRADAVASGSGYPSIAPHSSSAHVYAPHSGGSRGLPLEEFHAAPSSSTAPTGGASGEASSSEESSRSSPGFTGMPFSQHPFFKLPILELPEGVTVRKFNAKKAFMQRNFRNSPTVALEHMRNAFAKETLTASEADTLVLKTQRLVAHLFYQHRKQEDGLTPSDVVYVLGRRYLFLDAVVCAIQLLEPAMEASSWWEKLTSVLPSELDLADRPFPSSRSNFYIGFAKRLTAAIELLKTRVRPEPQETVSLKRELLCKKTTHPQFLLERWNDWRKQDRDAGGYQEDYEDYLSD